MNHPDILTIRKAFTHNGIFHADDVFSSALLLTLNPDIRIERGNKAPDAYEGIVFDISRNMREYSLICYKNMRESSFIYRKNMWEFSLIERKACRIIVRTLQSMSQLQTTCRKIMT